MDNDNSEIPRAYLLARLQLLAETIAVMSEALDACCQFIAPMGMKRGSTSDEAIAVLSHIMRAKEMLKRIAEAEASDLPGDQQP